jgi:CubicO group peptidase (beta-lactamase class C family)
MTSRVLGVTLALLALLPAGAGAGTCFSHDGFWGSFTIYCPRRGVAISVTVNAAPPVPSAPTAYRLLDLT